MYTERVSKIGILARRRRHFLVWSERPLPLARLERRPKKGSQADEAKNRFLNHVQYIFKSSYINLRPFQALAFLRY